MRYTVDNTGAAQISGIVRLYTTCKNRKRVGSYLYNMMRDSNLSSNILKYTVDFHEDDKESALAKIKNLMEGENGKYPVKMKFSNTFDLENYNI